MRLGISLTTDYSGYDDVRAAAAHAVARARAAERAAPLGVTQVLCRHLTNDQRLVLGSIERLAGVRERVADA